MSQLDNQYDGARHANASDGLTIRDLTIRIGEKEILHGINLDLIPGQITGLAGESGSGKSITGLAMLRLLPKNAKTGGAITFEGRDLLTIPERDMGKIRGQHVGMVFQDPTASLHPMLTIERQLTDHLRAHTGVSKKEARERALDVLRKVKVPLPETALKKYPHQFSGGQLQRIAIAVAIICEPRILIADEPTTALDVTVQAGVLRLLRQLCDELGLAVLLITHDLGVMSSLADRIAVLRRGEIVEEGTRYNVLRNPQHEYTKALIDALPSHEGAGADLASATDAAAAAEAVNVEGAGADLASATDAEAATETSTEKEASND
ncbi:ABC-type dipeptide/oligopeptide/nickel transport system ATPase component [Mycetocola sp. BIGb0189]|uniref:ABC transporter ATP-binding protein n=1 Tax=Mycetocola sp. BIGb0189 TaxID=2940604 RepID=UPI002167F734|nr:ABC transporter ATP-binding protein [Mycetocola sp. BIGb0189]MCS4275477.1 ABC-type dipeptide/oligopeptide/nickel transport system ATPase component [Mycetocola sp. BIGb0189]